MKNILKTTFLILALIGSNYAFCNALADNQAMNDPIAVCQNITKMLNANGTLNVNPEELDGGSYDLDGPVTFTADINYLFCENIGENSITLLVSDNEGYVSVCTAIVTVIDLVAPSAVCKDFNVMLDDNDHASVYISDLDNGSSDNCTITDIFLSKTEFTLSDVGANNIILTVADISGNTNECVSVVQIVEQPGPNTYIMLPAELGPVQGGIVANTEVKVTGMSLNLFPNPVLNGHTTVALTNMVEGKKDITIILYDIFGVAIRYERRVEHDIHMKVKMNYLDTLKTGVYTINVNVNGKLLSKQLVIR